MLNETVEMSNIPQQLKYLQDQGLVSQIELVFSNPGITKSSLSFIKETCINIKNEYIKFFEISSKGIFANRFFYRFR